MPTATLRFNLPQEEREHRLALLGQDLSLCLAEFRTWLRNKKKYGEHTEAVQAFIEEAWTEFHQILERIDDKDLLE